MTFPELQIAFLQNLKKQLDLEHENDSMKVPQNLKEACRHMLEYQNKELAIPVQNICITFLNTSYYFEKPVLRILFYAPGMLWKTAMMHQDFEAEWLIWSLEQYEEQLTEWAVQQKKSAEWIEVEKRHMLRLLLKLVAYYIKYDIMDYGIGEEVQNLFKCNEFLISFGEYMDWQLPVYMEREPIDIFQREEKETLRFCTFRNIVYRKKNFENLDLSGARFYGCQFNKCLFRNSVWNDVVFGDCTFEDITMEGGEMLGTRFEHCKVHGLKRENVKEEQEEGAEIKGFFRAIEWIDCEVNESGDL